MNPRQNVDPRKWPIQGNFPYLISWVILTKLQDALGKENPGQYSAKKPLIAVFCFTEAFLTKNGFQTFWETVAKKSNLRIHYNTNIRKVKRRRSGISLCLCKSRRCHKHDFVIWSPELKGSLKYFDRPTRKEKQIFSKMYSRYLISTLVDVIGGKRCLCHMVHFFLVVVERLMWW